MPTRPKALSHLGVVYLLFAAAALQGAEDLPFRQAKYGKGELKYIGGLPVLLVQGTPEEIGRQKAALTVEAVKKLAEYPRRLLRSVGLEDQWPKYVEKGRALLPQFPADHRDELLAFAKATGMDHELGIVANTLFDTYRGGLGCSSLIVEPNKSATGGPLFGRNMDFFTLGLIDRYSLVAVYRPKGKHAFVSIGFPGLLGCISGMNDAGLGLTVHEVFRSRDGSPMFNPKGVPYALCFRRMLEECTTIKEAERLLRSTERTTKLNLAVCDRSGGAVLEMTPKSVVLRRGTGGICACTNHFRSRELAVFSWCRRYRRLVKCRDLDSLDLADVAEKLDEVNQGGLTVHTMVFEPVPLKLHLAIGSCPSSALPLKPLELGPLFGAGADVSAGE